MHFNKSFSVIFLLLFFETVLLDKILCPRQCVCDLSQEYRRVSCEGRNLLDVVDVPKEVNIFSLRGNVIKKLDNFCFTNSPSSSGYYSSLIDLDLSENSISDMDMYAFQGLDKLEKLNLSRNRLEMIYQYLFVYNNLLEILDLSYNNFINLKDEPFLHHKTLKILNLSNTQLVQLYETTFSELPSLEVLNLSGNHLTKIHLGVLSVMPHLRVISWGDNDWYCNSDFTTVQDWLLENRIHHEKLCNTVKKSEKIMISNNLHEDARSEEDLRDVWNLDKEMEEQDILQHSPTTNTSLICVPQPQTFIELFNLRFPSSWSLLIGLQVGFLIGMFVTYFWLSKCCSCRKWKRRSPPYYRGTSRNRQLLNNPHISSMDTPPLLRRELTTTEAFPRSNSWETNIVARVPLRLSNQLILQDVNEMHPLPRSCPETPPPPYVECYRDADDGNPPPEVPPRP